MHTNKHTRTHIYIYCSMPNYVECISPAAAPARPSRQVAVSTATTTTKTTRTMRMTRKRRGRMMRIRVMGDGEHPDVAVDGDGGDEHDDDWQGEEEEVWGQMWHFASSFLRALFGSVWVFLGPSGASMGVPWGIPRPSWGRLGAAYGLPWESLMAAWGRRGALSGQRGSLRRPA